ncbi:MAG: alanine--glyoxylate aminotransferase family protein [Rhizobiales bacterium]|nr:alanine--glyoxylate aminotransferase family protein [Hyphomicrobiales bacterium]
MNIVTPPPATGLATIPPDYRLRLPGPTSVPERVRAALMLPVLSHRGPEFRTVVGETAQMLRPVFGTQRDILIYAASGTGVMEAALANVITPGEPVLIIIHGQFGERFAAIAEGMGAVVDRVAVEWGEAPDPEAVRTQLKKRNYRAVVCVHNESATGVVADIAAIGALVRETDAVFVVDSVSGAGGIELQVDAWGIDILVSASQKALMCPPGLGYVVVSAKGMATVEKASGVPRFYFDFRRAQPAAAKDETSFTAPVSLVLGQHAALTMIHEEGLANVFARHRRLGEALRAGGVALGLPIFPTGRPLSATVSVFAVPDGVDGIAIVRHLHTRYHTVIASQRGKLSGKVIRFGTMGALSAGDIMTDLHYLECTLRDLGLSPEPGVGCAAAAQVLAAA